MMKKYNFVGTFPKCISKIIRGKIYIPNTQKPDLSYSWFGIGTSIKRGGWW
jgi:hypothetical protein